MKGIGTVMQSQYKDCKEPFTFLKVLSNGDVKPCCWSKNVIGNLDDSSLSDIWNGNLMMKLRYDIINNRKFNNLCKKANCHYVKEG